MTFAGLLYLASRLAPGSTLVKAVFAGLWLSVWILAGYLGRKKIFESAIFFNLLVSAFIFGGSVMAGLGMTDEAQRLEDRMAVAGAIWENAARKGGDQVVNGIWSLATGGLTGQGPGNGSPHLVPAFHTDMIFTSIGEEMGWCVLALLTLSFLILLYRGFIIAYHSGRSFPFYLASGITLVTGIQFFTIVLGSLGIIPLTGVAVPFLSFGRTSLILNLAAMGVLVSISRSTATENQTREIRQYGNVVAAGIETFLALGLFVLGLLFNYMVLAPEKYLIRPAYVCNQQGLKRQEYNPRISRLLSRLRAGNILDRNNDTLATTTPGQSRSYPFGDRLFFLLGDENKGLLRNSLSYGYLAEYRYRNRLRGFSTRAYGKDAEKVLTSSWRETPFYRPVENIEAVQVEDYSDPRLLGMLREGKRSAAIKEWNDSVHARNLHLTVDARLQVDLQERMAASPLLKSEKLRASVVVLDAEKGDLLSSASYPQADQRTLSDFLELNQSYQTYEKVKTNPVLVERDLGMTYQTAPGSTAKIMSATAAFMEDGKRAADIRYPIRHSINGHDVRREIGMKHAIVYSHNTYFIYLVNKEKLYFRLGQLYASVGIRIGKDGTKLTYPSYTFYRNEFKDSVNFFEEINSRQQSVPGEFDRFLSRGEGKINSDRWAWAWGQGTLEASPLNMARVASIPANGGGMPVTRFVQDDPVESIRIIGPEEAELLAQFMKAESAGHGILPETMGGKTGTAERTARFHRNNKLNDAWYICFLDVKDGNRAREGVRKVAVAVRIERVTQTSRLAYRLVKEVVLEALKQAGYDWQDNDVDSSDKNV